MTHLGFYDLGTAIEEISTTEFKSLHKLLAKLLVWRARMHDKGSDMPSSCFVITVNFGQY